MPPGGSWPAEGVVDPERKRKIIGNEFIKVFEAEARNLKETSPGRYRFLAQGTLYPDVIESVSISGNPAALIKSHHNVGGLPEAYEVQAGRASAPALQR